MGSVFSARSRTAPARESRGTGVPGDGGLYRYPPPNGGLYFANHYYLGHKRFDTGEPEVFLFGELQDVNYLPSKPIKFPYKQPSKNQPLKTVRSFINIQRDSIKLVRVPDTDSLYSIQFIFDSDVDCHFLVWTNVVDTVRVDSLNRTGVSEPIAGPFHYKAGSEQTFKASDLQFDPASLLEDLGPGGYDPSEGKHTVPIALVMVTDLQKVSSTEQAQLSLCTIDKLNDGNFSIKIIKQKLLVDGMELLLQELYGIENKQKPEDADSKPAKKSDDDDDDDDDNDLGAECVICITENRDTLLLPCRHLCLCNSCAASLRYQSSNCPICRSPFRALLQIKAMQPLDPDVKLDDDVVTGNPKYAVPGYECVPLLQALNGYQLEADEAPWEGESSMAHTSRQSQPLQQQQSVSAPHSPTSAQLEHTTEFGVATSDPHEPKVSLGAGEIVPSPTEDPTSDQDRRWEDPLQGGEDRATVAEQQHAGHGCGPSVIVDIEDNPEEDSAGDGNGHQVCGSSVSSDTSTKSTDNLLHLANGKAHH